MTNPIAHHIAGAAYPEAIDRILGRCRHDADTGCLVWTGAVSDRNRPRVWVTNPATGQRIVTPGRRGVWMAMTGKPVPKKWRVYGTCRDPLCVSPDHIKCGTSKAWGKHITQSGQYRGVPARIAANLVISKVRRKVLDEHMHLVHSSMTLVQVARIIGVDPSTISHHRRSLRTLQAYANNPFAGLMRGAA